MSIELYCGCMYSGKSKQLIDLYKTKANKNNIVIKPSIDTRDGSYIKSRAYSEKVPCILVDRINLEMFKYCDNIFIDEYQFFQAEEVEDLIKYCRVNNKNLFLFGLDLQYTKQEWATYTKIKGMCDSVNILTAECTVDGCHEEARYTARVYDEKFLTYLEDVVEEMDKVIEIEGTNTHYTYEPRCAKHF